LRKPTISRNATVIVSSWNAFLYFLSM